MRRDEIPSSSPGNPSETHAANFLKKHLSREQYLAIMGLCSTALLTLILFACSPIQTDPDATHPQKNTATAQTTEINPREDTGTNQTTIINGVDAPEGGWPASSELQWNRINRCRITKIGTDFYTDKAGLTHLYDVNLTAGHCKVRLENGVVYVIPDNELSIKHDGITTTMKIVACTVHPEFERENLGNGFDAAICFSEHNPDIPSQILSDTDPQPGEEVLIGGMGATSISPAVTYPAELQEAKFTVYSDQECTDSMGDLNTGNQFCAIGKTVISDTEEIVDTCGGDSGSFATKNIRHYTTSYGTSITVTMYISGETPLTTTTATMYTNTTVANTFRAVGVTSWGHGCAKKGKYGVYTKIPQIINWISKITRIQIGDLTQQTGEEPTEITFEEAEEIGIATYQVYLPNIANNSKAVGETTIITSTVGEEPGVPAPTATPAVTISVK